MRKSTLLKISFFVVLILALFHITTVHAKLSYSEYNKAKKKLSRAINSGDDMEMKDALNQLSRDNSRRAVKLILRIASHPKAKDSWYKAALNALATMDSDKALKEMERELKRGKWQERVVVATVFGTKSDKRTEEALIDALDRNKRYLPVMKTVIDALAKRKSKNAIEPLIKLVQKTQRNKGVLWQDARQGLTSITGEDFRTADLWKKWWDINKNSFDPQAKKGSKKTATVEKKGPKFFSETIISNRVIFIIDTSGSMTLEDQPSEKGGGGVRMKRAKKELENVVKGLSRKVKFNIIAFSDKLKPWQKRLVPASRRAKVLAIKFIRALKAQGLTRTDKALEEAFKNTEANTFYLLTDGVPTKRPKNPQATRPELIHPKKIIEKVQSLNRFRKVKIFTMGFAEEAKKPNGQLFVNFLKVLAKANEGRFSPIH